MSSEAARATSIRFVICLCMSCSPRELPPRCDPYLSLCREIPGCGQRVRLLKAGLFIYNLYHTAGKKGQGKTGGKKSLGRQPRSRRKKREPGRGHYDKDRPAIIAWVSRQGSVVIQATRDFTVKTVQKAADIAMQAGSRLYTDSASSYRLITGYEHDSVNHTQKEYARGEVHENRAECLFSLLKPYLRVFRGISKTNLPGYVGFFQFLRNFHQLTAFEQAELILYAALDPAVASKARKGDFVRCLDHFELLQSPIN